jgi:hypothetical protein
MAMMVACILVGFVILWFVFGDRKFLKDKIEDQEEGLELLRKRLVDLQTLHDEHLTRRIDLECAIKWWCNDRMKDFDEKQYGRGQMRTMIADGKCWEFKKEESV